MPAEFSPLSTLLIALASFSLGLLLSWLLMRRKVVPAGLGAGLIPPPVSREMLHEGMLTRSYDYPHFLTLAGKEYSRAERHSRPLSVMKVSVDELEGIFKTCGPEAADKVTTSVLDVVANTVRITDVLGTTDEGDYIVLLPETAVDGAEVIAGRICRTIGAAPVKTANGDLQITASVGVSWLTAAGFLECADQALFRAKGDGGNRVVVW